MPTTPEDYALIGFEQSREEILEILSEMRKSGNFHNPTIDEIEQRIN
jgi:hypothetical protein